MYISFHVSWKAHSKAIKNNVSLRKVLYIILHPPKSYNLNKFKIDYSRKQFMYCRKI